MVAHAQHDTLDLLFVEHLAIILIDIPFALEGLRVGLCVGQEHVADGDDAARVGQVCRDLSASIAHADQGDIDDVIGAGLFRCAERVAGDDVRKPGQRRAAGPEMFEETPACNLMGCGVVRHCFNSVDGGDQKDARSDLDYTPNARPLPSRRRGDRRIPSTPSGTHNDA